MGHHGGARRCSVVHEHGNNSIGRITTSGADTNYTGDGISFRGHHAGPDGALWFTNYGNGSIGRITTSGSVTNYTDSSIANPSGHHYRARRSSVVHER